MAQPVLLKVYGNIYPAGIALFNALREACANVEKADTDFPLLELDGDLLRISFEGIFFPAEDIVAVLEKHVTPEMKGKLDVLDLETWAMTRFVFEKGKIIKNSAPLNNVLDYSGF